MHDGMPNDPIQGQGQGHDCLKATQEESHGTNFFLVSLPCCRRMVCGDIVYCFAHVSVTASPKSTRLGRLIEGALLYIRAKSGELWPRESPVAPK